MTPRVMVSVVILVLTICSARSAVALDMAAFVETEPPQEVSHKVSREAIEYTFGQDYAVVGIEDSIPLWFVQVEGKACPVYWITLNPDRRAAMLWGDWDVWRPTEVVFQGRDIVVVDARQTQSRTRWAFGQGGPLKTRIERLSGQASQWAFDYEISLDIAERKMRGGTHFLVPSVAFECLSRGTLASDDSMRNGTSTAIGLAGEVYYRMHFVYKIKGSVRYAIEARQSLPRAMSFETINKCLNLHLELEIPFTNCPAYFIHRSNGYPRVAMPLTLILDHCSQGTASGGEPAPDRIDIGLAYEFAPSPYLLLRGEYSKSIVESDTECDPSDYYVIEVGQDLVVVGESIPFLSALLSRSGEDQAKDFLYYRYSKGQSPPSFQQATQQSFGLSFCF